MPTSHSRTFTKTFSKRPRKFLFCAAVSSSAGKVCEHHLSRDRCRHDPLILVRVLRLPVPARSASCTDHVQRHYQRPATTRASSNGSSQFVVPFLPVTAAFKLTSALLLLPDPSIAASSPTCPLQSTQYFPHSQQQQDLQHPYKGNPVGAIYSRPHLDWAGYDSCRQYGLPSYPITSAAETPNAYVTAPASERPSQVSYLVAHTQGPPSG